MQVVGDVGKGKWGGACAPVPPLPVLACGPGPGARPRVSPGLMAGSWLVHAPVVVSVCLSHF